MADEHPTTEREAAVREGLTNLVATGPDPRSRHASVDEAIAVHRRRLQSRRRVLAGAAATTVAVGTGVTWWATRDRRPNQRVDTGDTPSSTAPPAAPTSHGWHHIGAAPLSRRAAVSVVWAGNQLVVLGGDPVPSDAYFPPPYGSRWTPHHGWKGFTNPLAFLMPHGFALWNGTEVVMGPMEADFEAPWNVNVIEDEARYGIAAYDPVRDTWRYVGPIEPDATHALGPERQAVSTDGRLIVAVRAALPGTDGHGSDVISYDPKTGANHRIDPGPFATSPYADASGEIALTAFRDTVIAAPNWDARPWILDLASETWTQLKAPEGVNIGFLPAIAMGNQVGLRESSGGQLWLLDPTHGSWQRCAPNRFPYAAWAYEPVWSGRELYVPGAAYDPGHDSWRAVDSPPRKKHHQRDGLAGFWAAGSLLLFGGDEFTCTDGAICDRFRSEPDKLDGWILE